MRLRITTQREFKVDLVAMAEGLPKEWSEALRKAKGDIESAVDTFLADVVDHLPAEEVDTLPGISLVDEDDVDWDWRTDKDEPFPPDTTLPEPDPKDSQEEALF